MHHDPSLLLFRRTARAFLSAVGLAGALSACADPGPDVQTITGKISVNGFAEQVLGTRAVVGTQVIATSTLAADGRFAMELPVNAGYRLEVITSSGARPLVSHQLADFAFDICAPVTPYDVGVVFRSSDPTRTQYDCEPSPGGVCELPPGEPRPCPPGQVCPPDDGGGPGPGDPGCSPGNPACPPPGEPPEPRPCPPGEVCPPDGGGGPPGHPGCDPNDPTCPSPPEDPTEPEPCPPGQVCDGSGNPTEPPPDGPSRCTPGTPCPPADGACDDSRRDNCAPACDVATPNGAGDSCWPAPQDQACPNGTCDPTGSAVPQKMLPDFGCSVKR